MFRRFQSKIIQVGPEYKVKVTPEHLRNDLVTARRSNLFRTGQQFVEKWMGEHFHLIHLAEDLDVTQAGVLPGILRHLEQFRGISGKLQPVE